MNIEKPYPTLYKGSKSTLDITAYEVVYSATIPGRYVSDYPCDWVDYTLVRYDKDTYLELRQFRYGYWDPEPEESVCWYEKDAINVLTQIYKIYGVCEMIIRFWHHYDGIKWLADRGRDLKYVSDGYQDMIDKFCEILNTLEDHTLDLRSRLLQGTYATIVELPEIDEHVDKDIYANCHLCSIISPQKSRLV